MDVRTKFKEEDDRLIVTRSQDVSGIVDYAKAMHNEGKTGRADGRYLATIPGIVIEHYCNTKGITFKQWVSDAEVRKRFLNDPDYSYFRIWKGKV